VTDPNAPLFAETLDPEVIHFGETKPQATICPWCGEALPSADLDACPHCAVLLKPADAALEVPGVTTMDPEVLRLLAVAEEKRRRKARGRFRSDPQADAPVAAVLAGDPVEQVGALRRPDAEVLRVMRELEEAARRAAAPAVLPVLAAADEPVADAAIEPPSDASADPSAGLAVEPSADPAAGPPPA
jgi:hypothetical protein